MDIPVGEAGAPSHLPSRQKRALLLMIQAFLTWLFIYMVLQGENGFFASTIDRIDARWVKSLFLNIPLQILLTLVATACAGSERTSILRVGLCVGALNGFLVIVHIVLSVATA